MSVFILLSILTVSLIVGLWLTHKFGAKVSLSSLNFASWYYIIEFTLMSAISCYTILDVYKGKWALKFIPENEFPFQEVVFSLSWCAIALPVGYLAANIALNHLKLKSDYNTYQNTDTETSIVDQVFLLFWLFIGFLFTLYTIYKIGFIPHIQALSLDSLEIVKLRGDLTHHYPGSPHLKELVGMTILPIVSYVSFAFFLKTKNTKTLIILSLLVLISMFFSSLNLNKSGVALYLVGFIFVSSLVLKKLHLKNVLITGLALFFIIFSAYKLTFKTHSTTSIINSIKGRVIHAQAYGNFLSFYTFPEKHEHIGFHSLSKIIKKLGFEYTEPSSRIIMKIADKESVDHGIAGFAVSAFFSEAWANWGLTGLFLSPLLVGFIIKLFIGLLISRPKKILEIGILSYISFRFAISSGINQIIFPRYIIISIVLLLASHKVIELIIKYFSSFKSKSI